MGYYYALGLDPSASDEEIKKAFRAAAKELHPDGLNPDRELYEIAQHIYRVLSDPGRKVRYDSTPEGHFYISELELEQFQSLGIEIPKGSIGREEQDFYSYWAEKPDSRLSETIYSAILDRAKELRVQRTWSLMLVDGLWLYREGPHLVWGRDLEVNRETVDCAILLMLGV